MLWSKFQFSIHIFGGILRTRVAQGTVQSPKQSFRCHGSSDSSRTPPRLAPCVLAMSSLAFVGPQATVATPQARQLVIRVLSCKPTYNCTTCFRDFRDHSYTMTNISNAKGSWPMQGFGAALGGVAVLGREDVVISSICSGKARSDFSKFQSHGPTIGSGYSGISTATGLCLLLFWLFDLFRFIFLVWSNMKLLLGNLYFRYLS